MITVGEHRVGLSGDGRTWIIFSIQGGPWRVVEKDGFRSYDTAQKKADEMNKREREAGKDGK